MSATRQQTVFDKVRERVPDNLIKQRTQGGTNILFIEWHTAAELLDDRAPGWSCEIKAVGDIAGKVYVIVAITIEGVTRESIGYEDEDAKGYGDVFSNATAMGLKRAAALFGLGRHLYNKDDRRGLKKEPPRSAAQPMGSEDKWLCGAALQKQAIDMEVAASERVGRPIPDFREKFKSQRGYAVWHAKSDEVQKYIVWLTDKAVPF